MLRFLKISPWFGVILVAVPLGACRIDTAKDESGRRSEVEIRAPGTRVSVKRDVNAVADIGLPVYPGAVVATARDRGNENANVAIDTAWLDLNVSAAQFTSDAPPQRLIDFYRTELEKYGPVTQKGSVDIQLLADTKEHQRIVTVKPRGNGSEFALVYLEGPRQ